MGSLAPLGVRVVEASLSESDPLPFENGEFDLVLNRHSAFNPTEIGRILAVGGTFLTQQVHGLWAQDLIECLGARPQWPSSSLERYVPLLEAAGLEILDAQNWTGELTFTDVGAVVYYLRAVPWLVPGFSVESHSPQLHQLQSRVDRGDALTFEAPKYLIHARKRSLGNY